MKDHSSDLQANDQWTPVHRQGWRTRRGPRGNAAAVALGLAVAIAGSVPSSGQGIDINQAGDPAAGLAAAPLRVIQDRLVFRGDDGLHGSELWVSNGDTATAMLADVNPGLDWSAPDEFVDLGGTMLFDLNPGPGDSNPAEFTAVGDVAYLAADDGSHGRELHRILPDGTHEQVADLRPGPDGSGPVALTRVGTANLLFRATDGVSGVELWRTDGVSTTLVEDISPGSASSIPSELFRLAPGVVVFRAVGAGIGTELWRTDGASATLVKDIATGAPGSSPSGFALWNGQLWFAADDGTATGRELWTTDGTGAGTRLAWDVNPGPSGAEIEELAAGGGALYFTANDSVIGRELFRYSLILLNDGFESGDTAGWPSVVP